MCTEPRASRALPLALILAAGTLACGGDEGVEEVAEKTVPVEERATEPRLGGDDVPPAAFAFWDEDMGLDFVHTSGADGRKLLPETMGPGVCLFDRDGDGDLDLYITNQKAWDDAAVDPTAVGRLYDQMDEGFVDVTDSAGLGGPEHVRFGQGVSAADYDGDGDIDLFLTNLGDDVLLRNDGATFTDVTAAAGVAGYSWADDEGREHPEWSTGSTFADLDQDGDLDLFVCHYLRWSVENDIHFTLTGEVKGYASPSLYAGSSCRLYANDGDGTFTDVSEAAGIFSEEHKALGVTTADVDGDGRLDLIVANDTQPNSLFLNRGDMRFEDIGREAGVGYGGDGQVRAGMGIDIATYSQPGELAIAVGNFSAEPISFFRSLPGGEDVLFTDDNAVCGLGRTSGPSLTFSTCFLDANLDGYADLLAINGHLEPDIRLVTQSTTYRQTPQLFMNTGHRGLFRDAGTAAGEGPFGTAIVGRGLACGDLDGDGDVDAVVAECGGPARVWRNDSAGVLPGRGLRVDLAGRAGNPRALGAQVQVTGGPFVQTQWVRSGGSYLGQHEPTLTFGVGTAAVADVIVRWPDGTVSEHLALPTGAGHELRHPKL